MQIIQPLIKDIGDFEVRRLLPAAGCRSVGPFVFWDHFGPVTLPPGRGLDVRPHPHVGLATLTYLFEGEIMHRDSLGCVQAIRPGAVNWMTAGRGIVHSERTDTALRGQANTLHGLQIWLALPLEHEDTEPAFHHYPAGALPVFDLDDARFTLIAGQVLGRESPVQTFSPTLYMETRLQTAQGFTMPGGYEERAVYVAEGSVTLDGNALGTHQLVVLKADERPRVEAVRDARIAVFGGQGLGPRHLWWNFVASTPERIRVAAERWEQGGFASVPGESEFIPLPEKRPWSGAWE